MNKKRYIIPESLTVEIELNHLLEGTNTVTGDGDNGQIVTDEGGMEEGDGDDAAIKDRDFNWGDLW